MVVPVLLPALLLPARGSSQTGNESMMVLIFEIVWNAARCEMRSLDSMPRAARV